jgi:hypothetical protein
MFCIMRTVRKDFLLMLTLGVALLSSSPAHAQLGVYATYTSATMTNIGGNVPHMNGATIGAFFQDPRARVLKIGADVRGNILNGDYGTSSDHWLLGPRVAVMLPSHRVHITPYGEYLFGESTSLLFTSGKGETHFMWAFVAGADYKLARYVDWRVVDFTYSQVDAKDPFNPVMVGTGLVARF